MTKVKTVAEITNMREGGRILAAVLELLVKKASAGMTTKQLAEIARAELVRLGGKPAFLGYNGFPDVLCVSINDAVVHGIPGDEVLHDGDILSLDFGVSYNGMITDAARSVIIGKPLSKRDQMLVAQTEAALNAGIQVIRGGCRVGDIAAAVQAVLDRSSLGIVRDLVGHGVGHELHEAPNIPNYGSKGSGPVLKTGMTIAIEPMATLGDWRVYADRDRWTVRTYDGSRAAHFEDTILITDKGYEILTR